MAGIPAVDESDTEDVAWALSTAETLWSKKEHRDALLWLERAANAARSAASDARAEHLSRAAAELERSLERSLSRGSMRRVDPRAEPEAAPPSKRRDPRAEPEEEELELDDADVIEVNETPTKPKILDPWSSSRNQATASDHDVVTSAAEGSVTVETVNDRATAAPPAAPSSPTGPVPHVPPPLPPRRPTVAPVEDTGSFLTSASAIDAAAHIAPTTPPHARAELASEDDIADDDDLESTLARPSNRLVPAAAPIAEDDAPRSVSETPTVAPPKSSDASNAPHASDSIVPSSVPVALPSAPRSNSIEVDFGDDSGSFSRPSNAPRAAAYESAPTSPPPADSTPPERTFSLDDEDPTPKRLSSVAPRPSSVAPPSPAPSDVPSVPPSLELASDPELPSSENLAADPSLEDLEVTADHDIDSDALLTPALPPVREEDNTDAEARLDVGDAASVDTGDAASDAETSFDTEEPDLSSLIDLATVEIFADVPDDEREALARAAIVQPVELNEVLSGFALVILLEGAVDITAEKSRAAVERLVPNVPVMIMGRGTFAMPIRLLGARAHSMVAVWMEDDLKRALRSCPWVEDELRAQADQMLARVGMTLGVLGERLDASLRAMVLEKMKLVELEPNQVLVDKGRAVPGLVVVGLGELVIDGGQVLSPGQIVFPDQVLSGASAPATIRAGAGGAVVHQTTRGAAQELMMTCPPLIEIFAGM